MAEKTGKISVFKRFPRVYWVVQSFELMERGAYYLMMPILMIYANYNLGVPLEIAAVLTVFMYPLQYGLPILSGAMAEKLGYRTQMIFAFSVLTGAYMFLSLAWSTATIVLAVVLIGLGIGSYKPLVSATVAKATSDADRNLAYSIYYWIVNLAAALFPTIWVCLELLHVVNPALYAWVFRVGAGFLFVNLLVAIFVFEEVPRSGDVKTVRDVLNNIKVAFSDVKFLVMVILISVFWALYSTMLNALVFTLFDFRLVPGWFTPMLLGIPNPLTIIALGIPLAKFVEKIESIRALLGGVVMYIIGLAVIGLTLSWIPVVIGIVIASVGEFMVAPGYLSFVSKLAPKEKVSAYIGCNFIASFLGLFMGTLVGGWLYVLVGAHLRRPFFLYGIFISIGLALLVAFLVYYREWGQDILARARRIAEMEGAKASKVDVYKEPFFFKIFDYKATLVVPLLLIPVILGTTYSMGTITYYGREGEGAGVHFSLDDYVLVPGEEFEISGTVTEGETELKNITLELERGELLGLVSFELRWSDEPDYTRVLRTWENQPDRFELHVQYTSFVDERKDASNTHGQEGMVNITVEFRPDSPDCTNGTGPWDLEITLLEAGDMTNPTSPLVYVDSSNEYTLVITTMVYTRR